MSKIEHTTYTLPELAARFQVTPDRWARWADRGLVPAPNLVWKGRPRWLREVVDTWEATGGDLFASDQVAFELDAKNDLSFTEIKQ